MAHSPQAPNLRKAVRELTQNPMIVLLILGPAACATILGSVFVFEGLGIEFPFWQAIFTIFFYSRMALAWHRWAMLGEKPSLRGKPGPGGLRRLYLMRTTAAVLMAAVLTTVIGMVFESGRGGNIMQSAPALGPVAAALSQGVFMGLLLALSAGFIMMTGAELPLRAGERKDLVDNRAMNNAFISVGSFFFSPIGLLRGLTRSSEPRSQRDGLAELGLQDGSGNPIAPLEIVRLAAILGACGGAIWAVLDGVMALLGGIPRIGAALGGETAELILTQTLYGFGALVLASLLAQHAKASLAAKEAAVAEPAFDPALSGAATMAPLPEMGAGPADPWAMPGMVAQCHEASPQPTAPVTRESTRPKPRATAGSAPGS